MNIQWAAETYAKDFGFVPRYGEDVITLLDCTEGSRVVDLGCGNGTLTQKLRARGFDVTGFDDSPAMIEKARKDFPGIRFEQANALDFACAEPADAVFSNAVFHWIDAADHDRLLANIASCLKPGGQLVFECGGRGCAETVHAALETTFAEHGLVYPRTFYFPTIGEYAPRLERAGLVPVYAALFPRPTKVTGVDDWIRMFVTAPFAGMDRSLADAIIAETVEAVRPVLFDGTQWRVDYVRLRMKAIRSDATGHAAPFLSRGLKGLPPSAPCGPAARA